MEIIRYKTFAFIFVSLFYPIIVWGADTNLTVLSSSESGFRFTYSFESDLAARLADSGSVNTGDLARTIQIAVPCGSSARVLSAVGSNPHQLIVEASSASENANSVLAEVSRPVVTRGRQTVGVNLQPVSGGGVYGQLEVEIGFDRVGQSAALSTSKDPAFEKIWAASLANYEVARSWPVEYRRSQSSAMGLAAAPGDFTAAAEWYKVTVSRTGLVRITGAQLQTAGISLSGLKSDSIRIFNAGGLPNSVENADPRPQFTEISLLVLDGGDGDFGSTDQLFFYGEAPSRWTYEADGTPKYVNNVYTTQNVYWLAVSGNFSSLPQRMAEIGGAPAGGDLVDQCWNNVHLEQDNLIGVEPDGHIWDYYNWYWSSETSVTMQVATPGAIDSDSAYVYVVGKNGQGIDLSVNSVPATENGCLSTSCRYDTRALIGGTPGLNRFDLQLTPVSGTISPFLDYVEVSYHGSIQPVSNRIDFALSGVGGEADVQVVDAFVSTPTVLKISDPLHPSVITGFQRSGGYLTFHTALALDSTNRFYCDLLSQAAAPEQIQRAAVTELRVASHQTDLIIVTAPEFVSTLADYVAYREAGGTSIQVVSVPDIIDNFSYGLYDPTAIRDFLKYTYENYPSPAPSGVLFVGDATYDYLDRLGTGITNWVPSFIRPTDRTYSDDNYVYFGSYGILDSDHDHGYDMMTARWPVRTTTEIDDIMAKIRGYESSTGFGTWRTRITLVADDEHSGDRDNETFHTTQTETLEKEYVPRLLSREKIYLWEYPFVNREKPAVNDAIVGAFNDGTLIVNYVGHGNPDVWSHEHVFQRSADLPRLTNIDRLPLVYAASCDIGFFDDPQGEGMGEDLLKMATGGAIAVISATRLVYAADNAQFNRAVYEALFGNSGLSIGEALFTAKVRRQYPNPSDSIPRRVDNDRAYTLFGDPLLRLGLPRYRVEFAEAPDSLVALQLATLQGRIVDESGTPYNGNGDLFLTVYDSERQHSYHLVNDTNMIRYWVAGPAIFRGTATIEDGQFRLQFVTPLDIGYRGVSARVSAYAILGGIDAAGIVDSLPVSVRQSQVADAEGPEIICGSTKRGSIRDGDFLDLGDSLLVRLTDSSGLNLAGAIGHGITLVIDDKLDESYNLNGLFEFDRDSYTTGRLIFPLATVAPGRHQFKIKAWDNVNNASMVEFSAEIGTSDQLALRDLLNHPNPMNASTTFYFELTESVAELNVSVYTLSGKKIWTTSRYDLKADRYPNAATGIVWDGRDNEGDRVGAGVYIYRVVASRAAAGDDVEKFGKLVVLN